MLQVAFVPLLLDGGSPVPATCRLKPARLSGICNRVAHVLSGNRKPVLHTLNRRAHALAPVLIVELLNVVAVSIDGLKGLMAFVASVAIHLHIASSLLALKLLHGCGNHRLKLLRVPGRSTITICHFATSPSRALPWPESRHCLVDPILHLTGGRRVVRRHRRRRVVCCPPVSVKACHWPSWFKPWRVLRALGQTVGQALCPQLRLHLRYRLPDLRCHLPLLLGKSRGLKLSLLLQRGLLRRRFLRQGRFLCSCRVAVRN